MDRLYYQTARGKVIFFDRASTVNIAIEKNPFFDSEWSYDSAYGKIRNFTKGITTRKMVINVYGDDSKRVETLNRMNDVFDNAIDKGEAGTLYCDDWTIKGYFFASVKDSVATRSHTKVNLTFVTDDPVWRRSREYIFTADGRGRAGDPLGSYPHGYPWGYASPIIVQNIINSFDKPCNVKIQIFGPCINPVMYIGQNKYSVNCEIYAGDYLEIDTVSKTVIIHREDGTKENAFMFRAPDAYIFEKIAEGNNGLTILPTATVSISVIEERSEPKWI